jgi:periplasmic protein TonB
MKISKTQKLNLLARFNQKEFFLYGGQLNNTKLGRFILIALLLHSLVITFQFLSLKKINDSQKPPPIKVKYIHNQKPELLKKEYVTIDRPKIKNNKQRQSKPSKSIASAKNKKQSKKKYSKQKKTLKKNIPPPKTSKSFNKIQQAQVRVNSKKNTTPSKISKLDTLPSQSSFPDSQGALAMLDDLNLEKYTAQKLKPQNEEYLDHNKPIPLDTKETKYVSYFNRIKQQIQLVWIYPIQAAEKKISGQLTLKFEISKDGNLLSVNLTNSSGFNILDVAAMKSVKEAAPYYPFPMTIKKKKLSILATFVYNPNQHKPKAQ